MKSALRSLGALACVALAALLSSQPTPPERVGPLPGGGFLLSSGWRLEPVGTQIPVSTFPMGSALTPDGKHMFVVNGGYRPPSISVIDTASGKVTQTERVSDAWLGIAVSPRGDRVYVGGGAAAAVFEFAFENGQLKATRPFPVVSDKKPATDDFVGDVTFSPDGRLLYATELYRNDIAVINPQSGMVIGRYPTGRRPYRILFHPDGKSYFVTNWADGNMVQYDAASGAQLGSIRIGAHPTDIVWRAGKPADAEASEAPYAGRLFVAAAHTNNVYVVGVSAAKELNILESINVAMTPFMPVGMTPSGLAIAPDGRRLYVACSDANVAAVVDISNERSHVEGFIPSGWYPTAVRVLPSGVLTILNGKGVRSFPNTTEGPNPVKTIVGVHNEPGVRPGYVGYMQTGTVSWIPPFNNDVLDDWTKRALIYSAYRDSKLEEKPQMPPIEHVIYIVKENRTYDQVLGDMKEGNGDASLTIFGEQITPNLHKIAREFVLLDNFYVNSDVSADGHNWSTAAIAPDYVQKLWPTQYAGRRKKPYDFEEQDIASLPPAGYLWTNAAAAGLSIRNFGYMAGNKTPIPEEGQDQLTTVRDPILAKVTNRLYRGFDLNYPDVNRAHAFLNELAEYEKSGTMPRLMTVRMGNDHTSGTSVGKVAPLSAAADNDYAVGMLVEGVSKSRFWGTTLICILEDDAQNGQDHVDSHRSPAFIVSPYVKRHTVDNNMYNTASMLRTMELVLGLRPMTQFDAAARPMTASFQEKPNTAPFIAEKPRIKLDTLNTAAAPLAAASNRMKFDEADEIDDDLLNEILWKAIKGTDAPAPVRSFFGK
jgi:DNA-binding beta-propeller fold protein YncE